MKKYSIYLVFIVVGLGLGWLLFSDSETESLSHTTEAVATKWTCSMHPQIVQPDPGDCPICGMDLIPAEVGAEGLSENQFKLTENAIALGNIQTTKVEENSGKSEMLHLSGKIVENEESNVVQVAYFPGRIEKLYVNFNGQKVTRGELLAAVYSSELNNAQQELIAAAKLKDQQPELYKVVRNKLKLWKLSDKQISSIEKSQEIIESFPIYATKSGVVTMKMVNEGDYVKEGTKLLRITNMESVWASFDLYENQVSRFSVGQEISVKVKSYPNEKFMAVVDYIDPVFNDAKRTVALRAVLKNPDQKLKIGMFVEGEVYVASKKESKIVVPATAVLWTGERSVVYVKSEKEPIFEMKEVVIGSKVGDGVEVVTGLKGGEYVVTNGTFTVDAAAQLQGKKSMMHSEDEQEVVTKITGFESEFDQLIGAYLKVKDALVGDDPKVASFQAQDALQLLETIEKTHIKHQEKYQEYQPDIKSGFTGVRDVATIEEQRNHFNTLSNAVLHLTENFSGNKMLYKQFCPMAANDNGAYWISSEEIIRNPYFGASMLQCGVVKEVIYR